MLPLTDLDIELLAAARAERRLPALVPSPEVARATYDKYETHLLLQRLGLPSPPTVLPDADLDALDYPVMVKPRRGSGARSIHRAADPAQARFFIDYVDEPVMVQRAMGGPELSIDCLGDLHGRCLNAIPRTMLESRGGESIKGAVVRDDELIELGRRTMEALCRHRPRDHPGLSRSRHRHRHHRRQHALRRRLSRARLRRAARAAAIPS